MAISSRFETRLRRSYTPRRRWYWSMLSHRMHSAIILGCLLALKSFSTAEMKMSKRSTGPSWSKRNAPLNCASYFGGDACQDLSQISQCVDVVCQPIDATAGDAAMGDCNQCTCATPGQCKVQCPPGAKAPNGQLCSNICSECVCNLLSCDYTSNSNQGGGPNPGAEA